MISNQVQPLFCVEKQRGYWMQHKTFLYRDVISLVYGKDHAAGDAAWTTAEIWDEQGTEWQQRAYFIGNFSEF